MLHPQSVSQFVFVVVSTTNSKVIHCHFQAACEIFKYLICSPLFKSEKRYVTDKLQLSKRRKENNISTVWLHAHGLIERCC